MYSQRDSLQIELEKIENVNKLTFEQIHNLKKETEEKNI